MADTINTNFKEDYEEFLCEYILPLLGIDVDTGRTILDRSEIYLGKKVPVIEQEEGKLNFNISEWRVFSVPCAMQIPEDDLAVSRRILQSFPDIAQYKMTGTGRFLPQDFPYKVQKKALYRATIQNGIARWLAGDQKNNNLGALFDELETWAVKTYEGKNVTMGFIINPESESDFSVGSQKWLNFMHDDASAMLTDCIHSVIELDAQCNFVTYHSLSEGNRIPSCKLSYKTPLRFSQMIQTLVRDKKRGVFLLNNGDIVLAKDQEVRFVRRNLRWLNLSYRAFRNALQPFVEKNKGASAASVEKMERMLESIFASVLDVSFSHSGGIVAVVGKSWPGSALVENCGNEPILAPCDDLLSSAYDIEENNEDIRALKRAILKRLIAGKPFVKLDRKLRSELLGLDGACIIGCNGKVQAFGAIIQNDSGSLGGGRGAAARKLSEYGMAVKISTDGYIEVYVEGNLVYSIK